jgi:hypothetical protein
MSAFPREAYRPHEYGEILGVLHQIDAPMDGVIVALIGEIPTILPSELDASLQEFMGRRIGILRLDGYHLRCLDDEDDNAQGNRETTSRHDETEESLNISE